MRILVCATVVPNDYENMIEGVSVAGNRFLNNLIRELELENEVLVLAYLGYGVDDKNWNRLVLDKKDGWFYVNGRVPKIKSIIEYRRKMKREIQRSEYVIVYNPTYCYLGFARLARKSNVKSVMVLADYSPESAYRNLLRKFYSKIQRKDIRSYDKVVALSDFSKKMLNKKQEFVCMEGGINQKVFEFFNEEKKSEEKLVLMYAGLLSGSTGVDMLLEAFSKFERPDVELWISGKGPLKEFVCDYAKSDKRIKFFGVMEYKDYLVKLGEASVLVNPRNMNYPENAFNFPSKIFEYLATGKPIISTKFYGWERFREYIWFYNSTADDLRDGFEMIDRESDIGFEKRRKFAETYLWERQVKKVIDTD